MVQAVCTVATDKQFIDTNIDQKLTLKNVSGRLPSPFETLSMRKLNIAMMQSQGFSRETIVEKLFVSIKILNSHRYEIYQKLNIKTDVELILLAN